MGARGVSHYGSIAGHPQLAEQFDVMANGGRAPDQVGAGTSELLWWACSAGADHRWQEAGGKRVRGYGCPFCSGRRVSVTNSLARNPQLAAQFDVVANGGQAPEHVLAGTNRRLWWACPAGPDHRWQESGARRVAGIGCPFCAGYRPSVTNSVASIPHLADQFDVAANDGRTPDQVVASTCKPLRWACPAGPDHRWQASGNNRVYKGSGCPFCAGKRVSVTNSLAQHAGLAAQFDIVANGGLTPGHVLAGTGRRVWWACPVGPDHRWQESPSNRVGGYGCPFCAGYRVSVTNSVASIPELAAQFDATRNARAPEDVLASTHTPLWWVCQVADDHRWQAPGRDRVHAGVGCPMCAGRRAAVSNSLARHAELVAQFDVAANSGRTPDAIVAGTHEPLWWACPVAPDHRWRASAKSRVAGNGCPACAGYQVSVTNSLACHPALAAQFDVAANGGRSPVQVLATSTERLWWTCPAGPDHRWRSTGANRVKGSGCPACAGKQVSVTNSLASHRQLAAELDPERNDGLSPERIVAGTGRRLAWICGRNRDHRWHATGAARLGGSGCPHCSLAQSSAREVRLAAELAAVLDLSVTERQVHVADARALQVDVLCRRRRIAVEYDGCYYHAGRLEQDRRKTKQLTAGGYTVIRVREKPLPLIGPHDIAASARAPIHEVAAEVLDRLAAARPDVVTPHRAAAYRAAGRPVASEAAEQRLADMLAAQADRARRAVPRARDAHLAASLGHRSRP